MKMITLPPQSSYGIAGKAITALVMKRLKLLILNPVSVIPDGMSMETLAKRLDTISQCFEQLEEVEQLRNLDIATADFEEGSTDISAIIGHAHAFANQTDANMLPASGFVQSMAKQGKAFPPFPTNNDLAEDLYDVLMQRDYWPDLFMILGIVNEPIDKKLFQIRQINKEWQTSTDYCLKLYRNFKHLQGRMSVFTKFSDDFDHQDSQETISKI